MHEKIEQVFVFYIWFDKILGVFPYKVIKPKHFNFKNQLRYDQPKTCLEISESEYEESGDLRDIMLKYLKTLQNKTYETNVPEKTHKIQEFLI